MPTKNHRHEARKFISDREDAEIARDMVLSIAALKTIKLEEYGAIAAALLNTGSRSLVENEIEQTKLDITELNRMAENIHLDDSAPVHAHDATTEMFDHLLPSAMPITENSTPLDTLLSLLKESDYFISLFDLVCHEYGDDTLVSKNFNKLHQMETDTKKRIQDTYDAFTLRDY